LHAEGGRSALLGPFAARLVLGVSLNPRYFQSAVPAILVLLAVGASAEGAWLDAHVPRDQACS
jgi:hypothetical protein